VQRHANQFRRADKGASFCPRGFFPSVRGAKNYSFSRRSSGHFDENAGKSFLPPFLSFHTDYFVLH